MPLKFLTDLRGIDVSPSMAVMGICVVVGAAVLTNYTRYTGMIGFVLNLLVLFTGAQIAASFEDSFDWPLNFVIERTLLLTVGGMLPASFLMLLLFPRSKRG